MHYYYLPTEEKCAVIVMFFSDIHVLLANIYVNTNFVQAVATTAGNKYLHIDWIIVIAVGAICRAVEWG